MSNGNGGKPMPEDDPRSIGNIMLELRLCSREQLQKAVDTQKRMLGQVLMEMGFISKEDLEWALLYQKMLKKEVEPKIVKEYVHERRLEFVRDLKSANSMLMLLADKINKAGSSSY